MAVSYHAVAIDTAEIHDWESFHSVFARDLGFFGGYGRNMDAWIDCMSDSGLRAVSAPDEGVLVLQLAGMADLRTRCPKLAQAIEECSAFVNFREISAGRPPLLALSYCE